ncbi:MAG TPA: glycosyltransferase [Mycobacteriales bacterium]|nr:glycosyltransferase [Mycobacteriales bacterium]
MDELAGRMGVRSTRLESMRRDPGSGDLRSLLALARILRRDRPQLVHTHAAKAGTLGRAAVLLAFPWSSKISPHDAMPRLVVRMIEPCS